MIDEIEWFSEIEPALGSAYVIKGLLDQGAMSVVYGPSNSGKTFLALDLAFHVAANMPWRTRRVAGGTVLYLAAEGGNGIANRMVALRRRLDRTAVPLALRRAGLDLLHPDADLPRLIELAGAISTGNPLRLLVIDTLSRVIAGGDENGPVDMTAFVANVDKLRQATGAHVLVVHHTGKDLARGARGHNSLRAATDTEIEVQLDEAGTRVAAVTKQRDHQGGDTFSFALETVSLGKDQDGEEVTSCVVVAAETADDAEALPSREVCRQMLKVIDEGWKSNNPLSTAPQSKATGRYAPRCLAERFGLKQADISRLLSLWTDNEIIVLDILERRSKRKGLRVLNWL
ncbi:AAA family ATPase [Arsenicitalea aurantiaca]|uniref:AAA family ATPase n=2 Tax=Arsenicitalea aurantiaca TaxID=1783274 RepID=A0A433X2T0_9HYPH|nr:AAA family ATPase [Arsenicitalea aurantiaca]